MSDYFLVGNLDDDNDLWFISKAQGTAVPVPKSAWLSIISMFQGDAIGTASTDEKGRDALAQSVIDNAKKDTAVSRNVFLSFSTSQLGKLVMIKRSHPVEQLFLNKDPLAPLIQDFVDRGKY
ncbi:hypothetical protein [Dongia sp.]|uniref:hypothetical protein n=1 Tax=Dongia sp. TaxID=1977262 RepID=UPI003751B04B